MFDTSGLNALVDDADRSIIIRGLGIGFCVPISETNLSEIAATNREERRLELLDLCRHLIHGGVGINPFHEIFHDMARAHAANPEGFDWRRVNIRLPAMEEEIARRELIGARNSPMRSGPRTD
jgi:hypothetical protein